jgi:hypothetical protein
MAAWCLLTGQSPSVYEASTLRERKAFVEMAKKMRR